MLITAGPSVMGPHCLREVSTLPTMSGETRPDATGVIKLLIPVFGSVRSSISARSDPIRSLVALFLLEL